MSRDGFAIADWSTGHFDDSKVRKLWRLLGDVDAMCRAMTMHQAVVLASWKEGRRLTLDEALPVWLPADERLVVALREARLLDTSDRVPPGTWSRWYGPAFGRREAAREAGREGAARRWGAPQSGANGVAIGSLKGRSARPADRPDRPSVPTDRPSRARARDGVQSTNGKLEHVAEAVSVFRQKVARPA